MEPCLYKYLKFRVTGYQQIREIPVIPLVLRVSRRSCEVDTEKYPIAKIWTGTSGMIFKGYLGDHHILGYRKVKWKIRKVFQVITFSKENGKTRTLASLDNLAYRNDNGNLDMKVYHWQPQAYQVCRFRDNHCADTWNRASGVYYANVKLFAENWTWEET